MEATVGALATTVSGDVLGDPNLAITHIGPLGKATRGSVTFLSDDAKLNELNGCAAGAILIARSRVEQISDEYKSAHAFIAVDDAHDAFLTLLQLERPARPRRSIGLSKHAVISESARIGSGTNIHPNAHIGEDVVIGENCDIHPGAVVGDGCQIGDNTTLHPRVVLYPDIEIGHRVVVHAGAVIGADGFGYRFKSGRFVKVPQLGIVRIEDDVEIGANATIDRGAVGPTVIGEGTKLDNLVQVAHNCEIGKHNAIAALSGIAGSSSTGDFVRMGGQAGVMDHVSIGSGVSLAGGSKLAHDVPAGGTWGGAPARPIDEALRIVMSMPKLPEMRKTVRSLEKELARLVTRIEQLEAGGQEETTESEAA